MGWKLPAKARTELFLGSRRVKSERGTGGLIYDTPQDLCETLRSSVFYVDGLGWIRRFCASDTKISPKQVVSNAFAAIAARCQGDEPVHLMVAFDRRHLVFDAREQVRQQRSKESEARMIKRKLSLGKGEKGGKDSKPALEASASACAKQPEETVAKGPAYAPSARHIAATAQTICTQPISKSLPVTWGVAFDTPELKPAVISALYQAVTQWVRETISSVCCGQVIVVGPSEDDVWSWPRPLPFSGGSAAKAPLFGWTESCNAAVQSTHGEGEMICFQAIMALSRIMASESTTPGLVVDQSKSELSDTVCPFVQPNGNSKRKQSNGNCDSPFKKHRTMGCAADSRVHGSIARKTPPRSSASSLSSKLKRKRPKSGVGCKAKPITSFFSKSAKTKAEDGARCVRVAYFSADTDCFPQLFGAFGNGLSQSPVLVLVVYAKIYMGSDGNVHRTSKSAPKTAVGMLEAVDVTRCFSGHVLARPWHCMLAFVLLAATDYAKGIGAFGFVKENMADTILLADTPTIVSRRTESSATLHLKAFKTYLNRCKRSKKKNSELGEFLESVRQSLFVFCYFCHFYSHRKRAGPVFGDIPKLHDRDCSTITEWLMHPEDAESVLVIGT